jgi:predicted amidohydrolase
MLKLGLVQMLVEGGEVERNRVRAVHSIAEAAAHGAQIVVLPETLDVGWTHPATRQLAEPIPDGRTCILLRDAARVHQVYVCSGLVERAGDKVYNAAVLIAPDGNIVLSHRKLNELDIGHACYDLGDRLGVAHTPLGTIGLMICADGFACDQVLTRSLGYMGAQLILSPSAWAVPESHDQQREPYGQLWRDNYGPPAAAFRMWIVGVSNVGSIDAGPWAGRRCIGCSLVVGPDGATVLQGPYGCAAATIMYLDIELQSRPARGTQWSDLRAVSSSCR